METVGAVRIFERSVATEGSSIRTCLEMETRQHTVQLLRKNHMVRTVFQISWSALAMCKKELAVGYGKLRVLTKDSNWMMAKAWVVKEDLLTVK